MHTELLQGESSDKISSIWIDYHREKDCISAAIKGSVYELLKQRLKQWYAHSSLSSLTLQPRSPRFVVPLPKEPSGFITLVMESKAKEDILLYGKLEDYQKFGSMEAVTPVLTLQYYTELLETKDLVLMRGDVNGVTTTEAQYLANQLQIFYLGDDKYRIVKDFNHNPASFNFDDVLQDLK